MTTTSSKATLTAILACLLAVAPFAAALAAKSPFEIDIQELDRDKPAPVEVKKKQPPPQKHAGSSSQTKSAKTAESGKPAAGLVKYTVKPGDHIFKILVKEFGMSNTEAENLIPEISRMNEVPDIRKLSIGQTLLIPTTKRQPAPHSAKKAAPPVAKKTPPAPSVAEVIAPATPAPLPEVATPAAPAPAPVAEPLPVTIHAITATGTEEIGDSLLLALGISFRKNSIIEASAGLNGGNAFSVKVDRYFEDQGQRFILNATVKDPFNYTLLRLLEVEGYKVIQIDKDDDFRKIAETVLTRLNRVSNYMVRKIDGQEVPGFMVGDGIIDGQVFITSFHPETPDEKL